MARENNIELFKKYIDLLDDVYKQGSKTAVLDTADVLVHLTGANEFKVPKLDMDGLGEYSRKDGYVKGGVTLTYETKTPDYDRGRKFSVDAMDNEESAGIAFGKLASEFVRTKVTPELDAYRFAKLCASAGTTNTGALTSGTDVLEILNRYQAFMTDSEVPEEGRVLFITPALYAIADNVDTNKNKTVLSRFAHVIQVPSSRFVSKIDLQDGSTGGEEAGGFKKATDGKNINFMIVAPSAVMQVSKHVVNKIIEPELNQTDDGWLFFYRSYGLCDVYDNKKAGIIVHTEA
ncbi:MAG: hypothetical protein J6N15_00175 [Ruminiclostridium sp.]|nr:hypothetical protein [Ruminiclostridium sp.]